MHKTLLAFSYDFTTEQTEISVVRESTNDAGGISVL